MSSGQATSSSDDTFQLPPPTTVFSMVQDVARNPILSLGCDHLDDLLRGGLRKGITELAGEAGAGKTQICLQLLLQVQLPVAEGGLEGGAFLLSTEGDPPIQRLDQMQVCCALLCIVFQFSHNCFTSLIKFRISQSNFINGLLKS
jgi:RecA/RadA recombinase